MTDATRRETSLDLDLREALSRDEFYLVYQPEIDLHTNAFAGVEALLRWRHPTRGVVNPADFLPLLESSGDIVAVGLWTLATACEQGADWHAKGYRFPVAVNTSAQQLRDAHFVDDVARIVRDARVDPTHVTLEFSQASLLDEVGLDHVRAVHELGVRVAIDDVVPGHPSFDQLASWPVNILKLDRGFVSAHATTAEGVAVIQALVHDARALSLRVIAAGVEDATQRDHLRAELVDVGQGFHFARPYEAEEIDRYLEDYSLFSGRPL